MPKFKCDILSNFQTMCGRLSKFFSISMKRQSAVFFGKIVEMCPQFLTFGSMPKMQQQKFILCKVSSKSTFLSAKVNEAPFQIGKQSVIGLGPLVIFFLRLFSKFSVD